MNKATRQAALIDLLQSVYPDSRTAREIATDLDVSIRTVERDLTALQALGAVTANRGRRGGYIAGERGTVLAVLSRREAKALIDLTTMPIGLPAREAIAKIQRGF